MPKAKEKNKNIPKEKHKEKKLLARADYRPEGWYAIVGYEGTNEVVFAKLSASEASAYEEAITEIQRIKLTTDVIEAREAP
jgi:hypothetical protein